MQNAKTGSFCLQIINWVKNCFGLANGRCCRTFNHLPYSRYVEYILQQKNWWWSNKIAILWTGLVGAELWEGESHFVPSEPLEIKEWLIWRWILLFYVFFGVMRKGNGLLKGRKRVPTRQLLLAWSTRTGVEPVQTFTPFLKLIFCVGKLPDVLYVPPWRHTILH